MYIVEGSEFVGLAPGFKSELAAFSSVDRHVNGLFNQYCDGSIQTGMLFAYIQDRYVLFLPYNTECT
jgi:hypothetical protein